MPDLCNKLDPTAYLTYKGYLIHANDPKLTNYSDPTPLYELPEFFIGNWILCKDRMPDPDFGVMVTDGIIVGMANVSRLKGKPFPVIMTPRIKGYEMDCMGDIIAWMPLPSTEGLLK